MESLCAVPIWLNLLDDDYAAYREPNMLLTSIEQEVARVVESTRATSVFAPLGLIHPDHLAVSEACLAIAKHSAVTWYLYMDLPYGLAHRRKVRRRIVEVCKRVRLVELDEYSGSLGVKEQALEHYELKWTPSLGQPEGLVKK